MAPDCRKEDETANLLRAHGLRATAQRRVIWEVFARGRGGHLKAEDVRRRARRVLPELARGTVYKALSELVGAGLLRSIDVGEARLYDAGPEPHEHFRCRRCGRIDDVFPSGLEDVRLDEPALTVERVEVLFSGLCADCNTAAEHTPH